MDDRLQESSLSYHPSLSLREKASFVNGRHKEMNRQLLTNAQVRPGLDQESCRNFRVSKRMDRFAADARYLWHDHRKATVTPLAESYVKTLAYPTVSGLPPIVMEGVLTRMLSCLANVGAVDAAYGAVGST